MKPRIKPRNPLVAPARFRKAGSHEKPFKTQRRADKVALAKQDHRDLERKSSKHESLPNSLSTGGFGSGSELHQNPIRQETTCKPRSSNNSSKHPGSISTVPLRGSETDNHPGLISR